MHRSLVILSCSGTKRDAPGLIPAIHRYDGPYYQDLRTYLRTASWPDGFSVGILSAKYGLIGGLTPIENYDQRMEPSRAEELKAETTKTLLSWSRDHDDVQLVLGKDYLPAIDRRQLTDQGISHSVVGGNFLVKRRHFGQHLKRLPRVARQLDYETSPQSPEYFLPDWDDMLDADYDFGNDAFSHPERGQRREVHCASYMHPDRICDGILISLAQCTTSKGILRRFRPTDPTSLAPRSARETYSLHRTQRTFGDCGAFSYVRSHMPTLTVERACSLYEVYGFDLGASVDHIPVPYIRQGGRKVPLTSEERERRVQLTKDNAKRFLEIHSAYKCQFKPVGVVQALSPEGYAQNAVEYVGYGYRHLALGGLVPLSDEAILRTVSAVTGALAGFKPRPWLHLFGVFRPALQGHFRELGVDSFDSATYFRKAWLRSSQNYLSVNGEWFGAIRVPMTRDGRTRRKLLEAGKDISTLETMERRALLALHEYDRGFTSLESASEAVIAYDAQLPRSSHGSNDSRWRRYKTTLEEQPWRACSCSACSQLGIDVVIFRGYNRNKRRGAHNTLMLYRQAKQGVGDS